MFVKNIIFMASLIKLICECFLHTCTQHSNITATCPLTILRSSTEVATINPHAFLHATINYAVILTIPWTWSSFTLFYPEYKRTLLRKCTEVSHCLISNANHVTCQLHQAKHVKNTQVNVWFTVKKYTYTSIYTSSTVSNLNWYNSQCINSQAKVKFTVMIALYVAVLRRF